jgi:hypothetical protein
VLKNVNSLQVVAKINLLGLTPVELNYYFKKFTLQKRIHMRFALISLFLLSVISSFGQSGYKIDFKVDGLKDTTIYLGYFWGEGTTYIKDTATVNSKGEFSFTGKQPL